MKELIAPAIDGFLGSFMLAGALIAAVGSGVWRVTSRLYGAFVHHKPLLISPGHEVNIP